MGAQPEGAENGSGPALGGWWPRAVMALAALAVCGVVAGAYLRGGSLDEYATVYFADPHVPLRTAWAHLWPGETNPPFFYLVARFWELVSGPGLFARRLVNLWPLGFVLAWFACAARRYPAQRGFLLGLALFACSGKFLLLNFTEYRDYFSQYCAALVGANAAIYVVFSVLTVPLDQGWRPDAALVARLAAQCQGTRIYAGMRPVVAPERIGLAEVAARYHLVLLPPGLDAPGGSPEDSPPGGCPVIYWSEYGVPGKALIARDGGDVARAANEAAGFGLDAGQLAHARGILGKTGVIVVVRP